MLEPMQEFLREPMQCPRTHAGMTQELTPEPSSKVVLLWLRNKLQLWPHFVCLAASCSSGGRFLRALLCEIWFCCVGSVSLVGFRLCSVSFHSNALWVSVGDVRSRVLYTPVETGFHFVRFSRKFLIDLRVLLGETWLLEKRLAKTAFLKMDTFVPATSTRIFPQGSHCWQYEICFPCKLLFRHTRTSHLHCQWPGIRKL